MNTILIVLYVVLIILWGINAGLNFSNERYGLAIMNIVCCILWAICLVLRIAG